VGQIIGPVGAGIIADRTGGPEPGLLIAAGILLMGALFGLFQRPLTRAGQQWKRREARWWCL